MTYRWEALARQSVLSILAAVLVMPAAPAFAQSPAPLAAYGQLPTLEDVALSPNGTQVAFVKTTGDGRNLYVHSFAEHKAEGAVRVGDSKLRGIEWLDEDNLLLTVSSTSLPPFGFTGGIQEWFQLITYNVAKRQARGVDFAVHDERTFNVVSGRPMIRSIEGKTMLFIPGLYVNQTTLPALFRYDVAPQSMAMVTKSSVPDTQWLVNDAGVVTAEFEYRDEKKQWTLYTRLDGRLRAAATGTAAIDVPRLVGFNDAADRLMVQFIENGDPVRKPLMLRDASWAPPVPASETFYAYLRDRTTDKILGGVRDVDGSHYVFFDNELQAHWNAVLRAYPGAHVDLVSHSDDFSRMIVKVFGSKQGCIYSLFDWYTHTTASLGKVYDGIDSAAAVTPIKYAAGDGMTIPAFLTLPLGAEAKNLPLVVLPHGGPAVADVQRFDWWAQALASRGYAVLQPNYRGSDLGYRFIAAGFGEWGRKMQTDLSDGVAYLVGEGIADPARVCIVGASYGGYAALAGIAMQPSVYRCAVSVAGLSDLQALLKWTDSRAGHSGSHTERYWDRFMGASGPDDPALRAISPASHVAAVQGPVLLIHGKDDTVVPYEQSRIMADALRRAGKRVEFVTLKHEDHWLSHGATRLQMLEATMAFLEANDPPNPPLGADQASR